MTRMLARGPPACSAATNGQVHTPNSPLAGDGATEVKCEDFLEQHFSDYLDKEAKDELCRAIEEHLARCPDCRVEVDTATKTILLYQAENKVELPVRVSAGLEAALAREYRRTGE